MLHDERPEPPAPQSSYLLVDSIETWKVALASMFPDYACFANRSLKGACQGRAVAVQLEGRRLGTEDGSISLIKVGQSHANGRGHNNRTSTVMTKLSTRKAGSYFVYT